MEISFFPYDFDYRQKDGKVFVHLFGKLEDGRKIHLTEEHQPYFYVMIEGIDTVELAKQLKDFSKDQSKVIKWEETEKELIGKKKKLWKIYVNFPKAVPVISKELQEKGLECYEKDILFIHRYLRDKNITPMSLTKAEGEYEEDIFNASKIWQDEPEPCKDWRILAFDIETYAEKKEINPHKNPILMAAFYGVTEKIITWKKFETESEVEFVEDEAALIRRIVEVIRETDPDIITGYFSDGFDFPYLKIRAEKFGIKLNFKEGELVTGGKADFRDGESKIRGILHIDILKFIRNIFGKNLKTDSYSLDNVAGELLGHRKHEVDLDQLAYTWDKEPEKLGKYAEYNLHDSRLTHQLCEKLLFDMIEFSSIVGLPLFDVTRMRFSRLVESYIMKRGMEFNVLAPNRPGNYELEQRRLESIEGAFVLEPTPGLYNDVVILDFKSLYPTIITTHNIGPESFRCSCHSDKVPGKEDYWFCEKKAFLPSVLKDLIDRRSEVKKLIKQGGDKTLLESRSYALKTLANSYYGYLGFFGARWYCLECAASTTAYARNYIKRTITKAEEKGFKVAYGDTDSLFVLLGDKKLDEVMTFMEGINKDLTGGMELEFEGHFTRGIFVAIKGTEKGAKKKYALLAEDGHMKITGFETVRRNWSQLAKDVQEKVLRMVLEDKVEEAVEFVRKTVGELRKGKVAMKLLILKSQITRELSSYTSIGPHVKVAREMEAKGEKIIPGTVVEYVVTQGTGLVRNRAVLPSDAKNYDSGYYINNQLIPAVSSILAVFGYSEEDLFKESSQKGLGSFM